MNQDPKTKLVQFLQARQDGQWKTMFSHTTKTWQSNHKHSNLKNLYPDRIKGYEVISVDQKTDMMCDITVKVRVKGRVKTVVARLMKEAEPFKPSESGEWGVNPVSLLRGLNI